MDAPDGELRFRKAALFDLPEVFRLFTAAIRHMDELGIPQWDEIYPNKAVLRRDILRRELFVGILEGRIACAFALSRQCDEEYASGAWRYPNAPFMVIHRLCVHPAFQNRRVAARAMTYIERRLSCRRIRAVRLDAFSLNPYALRLYERLGYEKTGEVRFRKGLFYLYEKPLAAPPRKTPGI